MFASLLCDTKKGIKGENATQSTCFPWADDVLCVSSVIRWTLIGCVGGVSDRVDMKIDEALHPELSIFYRWVCALKLLWGKKKTQLGVQKWVKMPWKNLNWNTLLVPTTGVFNKPFSSAITRWTVSTESFTHGDMIMWLYNGVIYRYL